MAEQSSLREYQRNLSERLLNLDAGAVSSRLGMRVGQDQWLIDLADAGEVLSVLPVSSVPLTQTWFAGVVNVRGNLHSVIDFAAFLGGAPSVPHEDSRLVLLNNKYRISAALLIDQVLGMRSTAQLQHRLDADSTVPWVRAEYTDSAGNRWKELDVPRLVQHADFLSVGV